MSRAFEDGQERNIGAAEASRYMRKENARLRAENLRLKTENDFARGILVEAVRGKEPERHLRAV